MSLDNDFTNKELAKLFCGSVLGSGAHRTVYANALDSNLVIKIEESAKCFSNIVEWEMWKLSQDTSLGRWLTPCVAISNCGSVLVQRRVQPVRMEEMPKVVPALFTDLKIENWGKLDGRIVCCDYGNMLFKPSRAMRKAKWWTLNT